MGDGTRELRPDEHEFRPYKGRRRADARDADTELVPAVEAAPVEPAAPLERLLEVTDVEDDGPPGDEPAPRRDWAVRLRVLIGRWFPWA